MKNQTYLTTTNDGQQVNIMGIAGGEITLWNPVAGAWEDRLIVCGGGNPDRLQPCFNNTAYVDGVANQSLQNGVIYYAYLFLPASDPSTPRFNFVSSLPTSRYGFQPNGGLATFTDSQGNICTLVGMVYPLAGSILSVMGGAGSRILTSSSPWGSPSQPLPANSGQRGGTFTNTSYAQINTDLGIYACQWAWRGCRSHFIGRIADSSVGSPCTAYLRPFAVSMLDSTVYYGPEIIVQFPSVGFNVPIGGSGVSLALDDGAYYYGIQGKVGGGAAHIQVEHVVEGWV